MITRSLTKIASPPVFYRLDEFIKNSPVHIKLEGLNIAGSIKLKSASWMVNALERQHKLIPQQSTAICSSSGNLGISLSIICKEKGYPFICVSDPNISPISEKYIKLYGGSLIKVNEKDKNGGYLQSRIELIERLLQENSHYVFVDQYANQENINSHYVSTAFEIINEFPKVDYLFIGAGTTGTLTGCAKLMKQYLPATKIIAVDAVGSVTFGHPPAKRYIPGIGTSFKPQIVDTQYIDEILLINEIETIKMCRYLLTEKGLFLGGSSGSVLQAVKLYSKLIKPDSTVIAISPDFGDRYLQTIYNDDWVYEKFPNIDQLHCKMEVNT